MKYTNAIKLMLPDINSTDNWGTAINYNFQILDREIQKTLSELENTKNAVGVGIPYYKELYIHNGSVTTGPYKFVQIESDLTQQPVRYTFSYYTDIEISGTEVQGKGAPVIYTTNPTIDEQPLNNLEKGIGAYVINKTPIIVALKADESQTYKQGDLLVAISEVGSIYDTSYVNIKFEKYPDTGHYIEPQITVNTQGAAIIEYADKNYIDWTLRTKTTTIQAVPAFHFRKINIGANNIIEITGIQATGYTNADDFGHIINFYTSDSYPCFCDYSVAKTIDGNYLTVTITLDETAASAMSTEGCYMQVYIGTSIAASVGVLDA